VIRDLQALQRQRKTELGIDLARVGRDTAYRDQCRNLMRNDSEMLRLWGEETALRDLRTQCADMNVINRALGRR
jgi:hypothetical protein